MVIDPSNIPELRALAEEAATQYPGDWTCNPIIGTGRSAIYHGKKDVGVAESGIARWAVAFAPACLLDLLETIEAQHARLDKAERLRDEVARLRARVRVEAQDVERAGVTREHVEAWLLANRRWESGPNGLWIWKPSNGGAFTTLTDDKRPDELAYAVQWFASREHRPGLDILDEMAAMQLEADR